MSMLRNIAVLLPAIALLACSPPEAARAPDTPAAAAEARVLVINTPHANARLTSPLIVEGSATGDWYFEAQFPAKIVDASGAVIAEAPAHAQSDWMTEAPVPYRAQLSFNVTQDTPATLVLQEDMPADDAHPREVAIPVVLIPR